MRPPSHLTVFKLYCKDSMSAGEIAKRCKCPKSTVMFRMKALKKLLRTDSLLRFRIGTGMFDSFDKVISDSRAKEIYRRGLAEAGERDGDEV